MYKFFKRVFDFLMALIMLLILWLPMVVIAILIKCDSKGPVLFKQERLGLKGKTFKILKFRSMVVGAEAQGVYSDDKDKRITKIGKILRKTSLDELPQLINILKGEMSFVGPRPPLTYHPWQLCEYTDEQLKMFNARPGITGWAQVNGRKAVEWNHRIELNVWYVENMSLLLDLKICFKTVINVLKNADNENTGATVVKKKRLETMYITNNLEVVKIIDEAGVDRIFVDMEYIGKDERQKGLDTVKNHHTIEDIKKIKPILKNAKLQVRVNPIHEGSEEEINGAINAGADIIMLPMFRTAEEVRKFVSYVGGRAQTYLLFETIGSVENVDEILEVEGIDQVHIGLNDMHLEYKMKFMFELLANGTVDNLCTKFANKKLPYGFGGIASLEGGLLPGKHIIAEQFRLHSSNAILSRSFSNYEKYDTLEEFKEDFNNKMKELTSYEDELLQKDEAFFKENRKFVVEKVEEIREKLSNK